VEALAYPPEISFSRQRPDHKISDLGSELMHFQGQKTTPRRGEKNPYIPELLPNVEVDVEVAAFILLMLSMLLTSKWFVINGY
jgi:hypothetical protein